MVDIGMAQTLMAPPAGMVTPEGLAMRQAYAKALLENSQSNEPVRSWSQGVGNMVEALVGGRMAAKTNNQTYALRQQAIQQMADALQGGSGGGVGAPMPFAPSSPDSPAGGAAAAASMGAPPVSAAAGGGPPDSHRMIAAAMNPFLPEGMQGMLLQQAGLGAPTEAIKDYQFAQRQGFKGSMLDYQTQKALASRPVTNVDVKTAGETSFSSKYGSGRADVASGVVDAGDKAATNLQKSNLLAHLLSQSPTGKAAPAFSSIGAWMQSIGLDPAAVGIDPKLPATTEAINGLANEMILGKIGKGEFPANNFSEADRNFLLTTIPQITDRPEAAAIKLEVSRRLDELAIHRADEWEKIANNQDDQRPLETKFAEFSRDWRDYLQKQDVFAGLGDQLKTLAPAAPAAAAPVSAAPSKQEIEQEMRRRGLLGGTPAAPPVAAAAIPPPPTVPLPPAARNGGVYPFVPAGGPL